LGPEQASTIQKFVAYRTAMLAAISHDLRTPLTRIRLRGELIEDEVQQARLFLDVNELQTMVDGALAFIRGNADEEAVASFDFPGVLQTIANDYADQDIEIAYEGPSHALYRGRPFALKRAFTNLIENAVKYGTPPNDRTYLSGKEHHDHGQRSGAGNFDRGSGVRLHPFLPARKLAQSDDGWGWPRADGSACDYPGARRRYRPVQPARGRTGSIGHAAADRLADIAFAPIRLRSRRSSGNYSTCRNLTLIGSQ
jgi:hypothetical protein